MPPLSSPLSSAERRVLRGKAQLLEPILKVGHGGLSPSFLKTVDEELTRRELLKIRFADFKEQKHALSEKIALDTGAELVQVVGNVAVFYRKKGNTAPEHPDNADHPNNPDQAG